MEIAQHLGLCTVIFTGVTYEDLCDNDNPKIDCVLAATDLLIDDPYLESEQDLSLHWRGSSNQRLIDLTPPLIYVAESAGSTNGEITLKNDTIIFHVMRTIRLLKD